MESEQAAELRLDDPGNPRSQQSRKRQWHSKARTGCITCKRRRVKCDETRPACNRCTSLDKECEGYEPPQTWLFEPQRESSSPSRSLNLSIAAPDESRALQFFHEITIPALANSNSVASRFWRNVIPQMGQFVDAIKHQMVAVASLQEMNTQPAPARSRVELVSHYHYGKALSLLTNKAAPPPPDVMLVSCLLSIAISNFRNNPQSARIHLAHGLQILQEYKINKANTQSSTQSVIEQYIEPIFTQLDVTAELTGINVIPAIETQSLTWDRPSLPTRFQDLKQARAKYSELCQWLYYLSKRCSNFYNPTSKSLQEVIRTWGEWHRLVFAYAQEGSCQSDSEKRQVVYLGVLYRVHVITLLAQTSPNEMLWDDHIEEMRDLIETCATLSQAEDPLDDDFVSQNGDFDIQPGLIGPVWLIACGCRDPYVRTRAVALLRYHHRKQGHEDDCPAAVTAECIQTLEEQGLQCTRAQDIPIQNRIRPLCFDVTIPGKLILEYTRYAYHTSDQIEVPHVSSPSPTPLAFKLYPLSELMRLAGYQGLFRPRGSDCMCKICATT